MFFSPAWRTHKGPAQMDGAAVVEVFTVESYSRLSSYTRELFCEKIKTHGFFFFSPLKDFFFFLLSDVPENLYRAAVTFTLETHL